MLSLHALEHNRLTFLRTFQQHWPTEQDHTHVDFVREGVFGITLHGDARSSTPLPPGSLAPTAIAGLRYLRSKVTLANLAVSRIDGGYWGAGSWVKVPILSAHPLPCAASAFSRMADSDIAGVSASGSTLTCKIAGRPDLRAASKAGKKSAVLSTVAP